MKENSYPFSFLPEETRENLDGSEVRDCEEIWQMAAGYYGNEPDESAYRTLGKAMWENIDSATRPRMLRIISLRRTYQLAAAACIALLLVFSFTLLNNNISIETPIGAGLTEEVLPDGSILAVNSGTELRYHKKFGTRNRDLVLKSGEVFFDVTKGEIPFRVLTGNMEVEVLGTSFNVRYRPDELDPGTRVAVTSGLVSVQPRSAPENRQELRAGQTASLHSQHNQLVVTTITPDVEVEKPAWTLGHFKFSNMALGNVMAEVERRFDVEITVESDALNQLPIGILKEAPNDAEEIIRDICALHCNYRSVPGGFVLTPQ